MKKTIKITDLEAIVKQAHEKVKNLKGGKNADYIPFLAKIDPNLFGIAVCLPTGEVIEAGDTTYVFGIESISKVHTAVLILKQYGAEAVLKKIGADATGIAIQFNHRYLVGERSSVYPTGKCRSHLRL